MSTQLLPVHLADTITEVAASIEPPIDVDETLRRITTAAAGTVPGTDEASISLTHDDGRIETLAPTDALVVEADRLQYELGQGPCLNATLEQAVVSVADLATDPRWPLYGPRVAELGFQSQIAFQLRAHHDHVRGALNLYAHRPQSFDGASIPVGAMFAGQIALAMGWARHEETLNEALASREVIGQAVGIVMERYRIDAGRAFAFLVRTSRDGNVKLRDIARDIVDHVSDDKVLDGRVRAQARRLLRLDPQ
jgi:hypothetical protein